jgi:hypothetical protein
VSPPSASEPDHGFVTNFSVALGFVGLALLIVACLVFAAAQS